MGLTVLSLFDGIAGARMALHRAGVPVDTYYASEIDPYAMAIANYNFPDVVQLGNIENFLFWNIPWDKIDLVIGGSPCTQLSRAGNGKGLKGDQSRLFYIMADIWRYVKASALPFAPEPNFLLENVKMKQEWQDMMSEEIGLEPTLIDSALVSAQRRERLYWSTLPITQPEDRGIMLKDVLFSDVIPVALHNIYGGFQERTMRAFTEKSPTIRANSGGGSIPYAPIASVISQLALSEKGLAYMNRKVADGRTHWDFKHHSDVRDDKSATVVANWAKGVPYNVLKDLNGAREFHPVEVERLQTYPDYYTAFGTFDGDVRAISKTQRLRALGNSFTVDVIAHILAGLIED